VPEKKVVKLPKRRAGKAPVKKPRPPKPHWFKMEAFWEGKPSPVMKIGGENIVLCGWVPPYNDVAICLAPPSVTQQQGLAL